MKVLRRLMSWLIDHRTINRRVDNSRVGNSTVSNRINAVLLVIIYLLDKYISHD